MPRSRPPTTPSPPQWMRSFALTGEVWSLAEPLRVRMGIHTGAAEERDGDYYGPAVNRAARVAAAAHGGQILVSHASEELGRDSLPPGGALHRPRRAPTPRSRPRRTGLPTRRPRLDRRVPAAPLGRCLPGQSARAAQQLHRPRTRDVASIADVVRDARLVTLTGVGGVGKTRLAIQVAAELLPHFPDGAWLCELSPATDPDTLDQIVASALGVTPRERYPAREHRRVPHDAGSSSWCSTTASTCSSMPAGSPTRSSGRDRACACSPPAARDSAPKASRFALWLPFHPRRHRRPGFDRDGRLGPPVPRPTARCARRHRRRRCRPSRRR